MNKALRWLAATVLVVVAGCASTPLPRAAPPSITPLLLVSIDAYRHDYLERGRSPTLAMLARTGVRADSMQPAFPSLTFPNHYTLVTGLTPDHHGIVNNTMHDAKLGKFALRDRAATSDGRWWAQGTPLWETANRHGLRTATMFWPGSEAEIHGYRPDYWFPFDDAVTSVQRVDQVLAWLDLPAAQRPSFITLYFDAVDHAGHQAGPDSVQVDQALDEVDAAMARLVAGLRARALFDHINIVVVSDHGMASVPAANSILMDQLVDLSQVRTVSMGILAGFNPKGANATERAAFANVEATLQRPHAHMRCWDKTKVPARFAYGHNPRVPQLLCLANTGWRITTSDYLARRGQHLPLGEHGYDNADPEMQAIFIAHGPAFRTGARIRAFPNVDVYPLLAHLLELPPVANDGDAELIRDTLKPASP